MKLRTLGALLIVAFLAGSARAQSSPNAVAQSLDPCSIYPHSVATIPQGTPTALLVQGIPGRAIYVCRVVFSEISVTAAPLILSYGQEGQTVNGTATPCATASATSLLGINGVAGGNYPAMPISEQLGGGAAVAGTVVNIGEPYSHFIAPMSSNGSVLGSGATGTTTNAQCTANATPASCCSGLGTGTCVGATYDLCAQNLGGVDVSSGFIEYVQVKPLGQ